MYKNWIPYKNNMTKLMGIVAKRLSSLQQQNYDNNV